MNASSNEIAVSVSGLNPDSILASGLPSSRSASRSSADLPVRIYSPEPLIGHPLKLLHDLIGDIWAGRELAWRLFVRDTAAQYRQTFLGYAWALLPPLVGALTFVFLNSQGLFTVAGTAVPYAAFAMIGTLLWQTFVEALQSPSVEINAAKPMLTKINFPREAILVCGVGKVIFNILIRLVLLAGTLIWFKIGLTSQILFLPIAVAALLCCGLAIGMALAPIGSLYGDIGRIIGMVSGFWMLLTPVVYPSKVEGLAGWLAVWNPVSPLIITARQCITGEAFTHLLPFAMVFAGSGALLLLGLIGFRLAMPHLIARMGG
jgi:lipopolysaccharide transport system permease protein